MPNEFDFFRIQNESGIPFEEALSACTDAPILIVGLGGTGIDAMLSIKSKLLHHIKPTPESSTGNIKKHTIPKNIGFLAVDSDPVSLRTNTGIASISDPESVLLINNQVSTATPPHWLDKGIDFEHLQYGAGSNRQIGRLLLFQNIDLLVSRIKVAITTVTSASRSDRKENNTLTIVVLTGIGGVTGSGLFLDMAYLLRTLGEQYRYQVRVFGFLFTPDLKNSLNTHSMYHCYRNSYAALRELDYWMSGQEFNQKYPNKIEVHTNVRPFDFCTIISSQNSRYENVTYEKAIESVSDALLTFLIDGMISDGKEKYAVFFDNTFGIEGKYCALGSSAYEIPYNEILTLLTSDMFDNLDHILKNRPDEQSAAQDITHIGLSYETIFKDILTLITTSLDFDHQPFYDPELIRNVDEINDLFQYVKEKFAHLDNRMLSEFRKSWLRNQECKIKDFMIKAIALPDHGPLYLEELINSTVPVTLQNYKDKSNNMVLLATQKTNELQSEINSILQKFASSNTLSQILSRDRYKKVLFDLIQQWIDVSFQRLASVVLSEGIDDLQSACANYSDYFFRPLEFALSSLSDIVKQKAAFIRSNDMINREKGQFYSDGSILAVEFRNQFGSELDTDVHAAVDAFLQMLSDLLQSTEIHADQTITHTSVHINEDIAHSLVIVMKQVFSHTLLGVLSLDTQLSSMGIQSCLDELSRAAEPLAFINRGTVYQKDRMTYIAIPYTCSNILEAAKQSMQADVILQSDNLCGIRLVIIDYGIPIHAFQVVENYRQAFFNNTKDITGLFLDSKWLTKDIFLAPEAQKEDQEILALLQRIDDGYSVTEEDRLRFEKINSLRLSGFILNAIPYSISMLTNLRLLDLSNTGITYIPDSIGSLVKLNQLILNGTGITFLPHCIGQLISLKTLSLRGTAIKTLPEEIGSLVNLIQLDLRNTVVTTLPDSIGNLVSLEILRLSFTQISSLPDSIGNLSKLKKLTLSSTAVHELPQSMSNLLSLEALNLSYNDLPILPASIKSLLHLQILNMRNTKVTVLPTWLGELRELKHIDLAGLSLQEIPESLTTLGIPFVDQSSFPYQSPGINLYKVVLTTQRKTVFLESPEMIPELYNDQVPLRECKVIVLGDGGVGKSYTILRIHNGGKKESENEPYKTEETHGVKIEDFHTEIDHKKVTIHFWDFGGQEILHSMHRCFLTEQTCYVIMVRTRETVVTDRARYWLRTVQSFAPDSPVMLFVNCWGNASGDRAIDETRLASEFPQIKKVVYCSSKTASDSDFQENVITPLLNMVSSSEIFRMSFNRKWNALRRALSAQQQRAIQEHKKYYLNKDEYLKLCSENGIADANAAALLTVFNNLGVCFSYHWDDNHSEFADYKLLNPVWLTNALYAIIEEGSSLAQEGKIREDAIRTMLHNKAPEWIQNKLYRRTEPDLTYEEQEIQYIIDVAESFSLCYRLENDLVFIPALCTSNTPVETLATDPAFTVHGEYRFCSDYLPDSVIHQLMIRCLQKGYTIRHCWLSGMELGRLEHHRAIIRIENQETLHLSLYAQDDHPIYELLPMLREEILSICQSSNLETKEMIVAEDDCFPVLQLLKTYRKGQEEIVGSTSGKDYTVFELLEHFFDAWTIANMEIIESKLHLRPYQYHPVDKSNDIFRTALLDAYRSKCVYCGRYMEPCDMQVDHILARNRKLTEDSHVKLYLAELQKRNFNLDAPDYIENFFPSCAHCNRTKSNEIWDAVTLREYHAIALIHTPKVLRLMEKHGVKYQQTSKEIVDE